MRTNSRSLGILSTLVALTLGCSSAEDSPGPTSSSSTGAAPGGAGTGAATSSGVTTSGAGGAASSSTGSSSSTGTGGMPPSTTPTSANLWVDPDGGSCVRQASPGDYVDAEACSWNEAYQAAVTGDAILVKGGSYGDVEIGPDNASLAAPGATFYAASGESVVVNDFQNGHISGAVGGSNVTFVGPVQARTFRSDQADHVTVDGWDVDCGGCVNVQIFHIEAATEVTVQNSEISNNANNSLVWISGSKLTFVNNRIHDAGLEDGSGAHTECMYAWDVTDLRLERNHFYHCSVMDVFITGSDVASGGYVENNVFERPWSSTGVISSSALAFHFRNGGSPSPDPDDWDFRYNTFVGPLSITDENPVGPGGMRVIGNVFLADAPCGQANTTYSHNAFVSGGCGSSSITNSLATYQSGFTSTGDPGDYSLLAGSVLRDAGDLGDYPAQDLTGKPRYAGSAPDIGAYEE